ncbi:MAG: hypothetical protein US31_C0002G0017 [Berkelbacteria bacterium GW2011_GWA1_36_9]|uniref:Histidine kinase/HSP90-like ATPase domain-containing protein n=1 Tax=Berkelbacteria bacterium GW2011_GWA1_36_9 TaxID=1618331 RepID=A0A0G0FLK3_9BACT|nr:MAG: hypothetical protein US31_C0002G0017 [Berkelbacteria bacterium GW2011_GWA1_36_9]
MSVQNILDIGSSYKFKEEGINERGQIKRWIADDDKSEIAHHLRHEVGAAFESVDFLEPDQQSFLAIVLGEALTNACKCLSDQHSVDITWEKSLSNIQLRIANPSDRCYQGQISLPDDCFANNGRGLAVIEALMKDIDNKDGIHASCSLCYYRGRMVFQIAIGR